MKINEIIVELKKTEERYGNLECFDASGSLIIEILYEIGDDNDSFVGIYSS